MNSENESSKEEDEEGSDEDREPRKKLKLIKSADDESAWKREIPQL